MRRLIVAVMGAALLTAGSQAWAHHAFSAEFDVNRPLMFTGTVSKVELINPHSWIHVDVRNDDGTVTTWMIEGGSPNALLRRGINRNTIPIGSVLVIDGYGSRDGGYKAVGVDVKFEDGRELFLGGSQPDQQ